MRWVPAGVIAVLALALPASAQDSKPLRVQPKPKVGGPRTTFVVRYESLGQDAFEGEYLNVGGPPGTSCEGDGIIGPVGNAAGTQVIHMGPRVKEEDFTGNHYGYPPTDENEKPLKRWCRGVWRGIVYWDDEDEKDQHVRVRFRFRVK